MRNFTKPIRLLAATGSIGIAAGLAVPVQAQAQDAGPPAVAGDTIIVSGFRQSLNDALNIKKDADGISDSISAEDIGKSTDANIAEALQRVTGIAIDRTDGEGTTVTVRGAGPSLNNVTLNGIPIGSTGDNQEVDFSQFSSDILQSITVFKTAQADQNEGSLGGNIVLRTFRPLNVRKDRVVLQAQARYNDLIDEDGFGSPADFQDYRLNASIVKKFLDDTLGISIVATKETRSNRRDEYDNPRYRTLSFDNNVFLPDGTPYEGNAVDESGNLTGRTYGRVPLQIQYKYFDNTRDRDSVTGTVQWEPTDNTELLLTSTYSEQKIHNFQSLIANTPRVQAGRTYNGRDNDEVSAAILIFDPSIQTFTQHIYTQNYSPSGGNDNPIRQPGVIRMLQRDQQLTNRNFILGGELTQSLGDFEIKLSGGRSITEQETDFNRQLRAGVSGPGSSNNLAYAPFRIITSIEDAQTGGVDGGPVEFFRYGYSCSQDSDGELFCPMVLNEGLADDGSAFRANQLEEQDRTVRDEIWSAYLDMDWDIDLGPLTTLHFGAKYENRRKQNEAFSTNYGNSDFEGNLNGDSLEPFVIGSTPSNWGEGLGFGRDHITNGWFVFDFEGVLENVLQDGESRSDFAPMPLLSAIRDIETTVYGGYAMADFEAISGRLFGNIGVRYAKTEVDAAGFSGFGFFSTDFYTETQIDYFGSLERTQEQLGVNTFASNGNRAQPPAFATLDTHDYENWLPSANINFFLTPEFLVRAAASKTIARPRIDSLKPGFTINETPFGPVSTGNFGSTRLLPFKSENIDVSLEWYFAPNSLFSVAFFNKELSNFEEDGTFISYWRDLRSEFFDADGNLLPDDQIDFSATVDQVLIPTTGGPLTAGCFPNRETNPGDFQIVPPEAEAQMLAICDEVQITQARNGQGGHVRGIEAQFQHDFTWLPGFFSGFGVQANYTYSDSLTEAEVVLDANGNVLQEFAALPLQGTSEHTFNGTLYWEKDGNLVRLAYNYRTDYLIDRSVRDGGAHWIEGFDTLDLSANWRVSKAFSLNFQAQNLTDSVTRTYTTVVRDPNLAAEGNAFEDAPKVRTRRLQSSGRVFRIGARIQF